MHTNVGWGYEREEFEGDSHFLQALFDFSFSEFVTVQLVRTLYVLLIIMGLFSAVMTVVALFSQGLLPGLFSILLAPLGFLVWVVAARVSLELFVVVFRIAGYLRELAKGTE